MKKITINTLIGLLMSTTVWAQGGSVFVLSEPAAQDVEEQEQNVHSDIANLVQEALNEKFNYLKHNDLRDVVNHDRALPGTSNHILMDMEYDAAKYAGANVGFYVDKGSQISAVGPLGHVTTNENNRNVFKVTDARADRRSNAILGVSYERIWDVTGEDKVFDIDLMLFIHSSERGGYYFRKINIETNWHNKVNITTPSGVKSIASTTVKKVYNEVPLSETDFELRVELASQKAILFDKNHGITKVFPITAGALDIRSSLMGRESLINSMSLLLPGRSGNFADFKLEDSVLIKRSKWTGLPNQESRVEPSYYKGRPFIGIIDRSRMSSSGTVNYYEGYREVGFHYQIDDGGLKRGFESHGCIRLQDHDLYVLDAILNGGPKDMVPVEVKMVLDTFKDFDSIYSRQSSYKKVIYSSLPSSPQTIKCENKPSYPVRFFDGGYHTVADSDCLTKISSDGELLQNAVDYMLGLSYQSPSPLKLNNVGHAPIVAALDEIRSEKYQNILTYTFTETFPNSTKWVGDLNQDELNLLLTNLRRNYEYNTGYGNNAGQYGNNGGYNNGNGNYNNGGGNNNNDGGGLGGFLGGIFAPSRPVVVETVWPDFSCSRSRAQSTTTNLQNYNHYCRGKAQRPTASTPSNMRPRINNCGAFFNALLDAGCGYR